MAQVLTIIIPNDGGDPEEAVVSKLVGIGLLESDARRLVENEMVFESSVNIPLSQLFYGKRVGRKWQMPTAVESSAATKLLTYMQMGEGEPLTDEEQAVLTLTITRKVLVKGNGDGFLERAGDYCKSEKVLERLLTQVITPASSYTGTTVECHAREILSHVLTLRRHSRRTGGKNPREGGFAAP